MRRAVRSDYTCAMCGILAFYAKAQAGIVPKQTFETMLDQLAHRGPDERSAFYHERVGLGHTRLSIIDLATGSQPMFNETQDVACILNGEIYNFRALRSELEERGHRFASSSDTEVIVHLYEEVGEAAFSRLEGMFGVVLYDLRRGILLVARDRLGEKPVYFHESRDAFLCASELKALLRHPGVSREIDPQALAGYLYAQYVPAPLSIFGSIRKLKPGHYLRVVNGDLSVHRFWNPRIGIDASLGEREAIEGLRDRLSASVRARLVADVPLGIFLSGGIDSSAVVAFAAAQAAPIKTYSVGFGAQINELPFARKVAQHFGTDHTEIVVEARLSDEVVKAAACYDEPFADTSSVPTYVISREARKHVKVVLTGDGGDELFAGYESYIPQKYYSPSRLVRRTARLTDLLSLQLLGRTVLDGRYPLSRGDAAYAQWMTVRRFFAPSEIRDLLRRDLQPERSFKPEAGFLTIDADDPLSAAFQCDVNFYLPDDLLKKMDIASMAHGLESRAPFLDHRLVEFALSIPPALKLRNNVSKYLLRKAMVADLPEGIAWRPKQGFGAPVASWLEGDLKSLVHDALGAGARVREVLDPSALQAELDRFERKSSRTDWRRPFRLWAVLMLELWLRSYVPRV
jgi:asparagine synthase (glutamine-hydrolysing)